MSWPVPHDQVTLGHVEVTEERRAVACNSNRWEEGEASSSTRFSEYSLRQCFQFIGCKPRRSQKVARKVFWLLAERERSIGALATPHGAAEYQRECSLGPLGSVGAFAPIGSDVLPPRLALSRSEFEQVVISCLGDHPRHLPDDETKLKYFRSASRVIVEKTETLVVLLCGTSGTGKSTLASLVASRLGIAHVVSTDVIRNLLRGLDVERRREYLWKSTYEGEEGQEGQEGLAEGTPMTNGTHVNRELSTHFLQQRHAILERAELLVESFVDTRKESLIIEGVHLSGAFAARMMERFPCACILPFLVHISNAEKHLERFAVRAKAMTLRPDSNRYVKHLGSIRGIQRQLIEEADEFLIPQVDNTNVDRSLAAIHETVLGVLEGKGEVTMQKIHRIFGAKNGNSSGKDAKARIKELKAELRSESPLSSSTSLFTLHRPPTVDQEIDNVPDEDRESQSDQDNSNDGSDENDSEYQDVLHEIQQRLGNDYGVDGSVHTGDDTTTQGLSMNE